MDRVAAEAAEVVIFAIAFAGRGISFGIGAATQSVAALFANQGVIAKAAGDKAVTLIAESVARPAEIAMGLVLRSYRYTAQKSQPADVPADASVMCKDPEAAAGRATSATSTTCVGTLTYISQSIGTR